MSSIYNSSYEELLSNSDSYDEYLGEILKVEDKLWWNRASEKNTQMAYENYLLDYPNGIYKSKAKRKVDEFIAITKEKELERRRLEEVRLAEVVRKQEEEKARLAEVERKQEEEKARLAEVERQEEEIRLFKVQRKYEEEKARLAELERQEEETRLFKVQRNKYLFIGGVSLYLFLSIYSLGFMGALGLVVGSIIFIIGIFNILDDDILMSFAIVLVLIVNIAIIYYSEEEETILSTSSVEVEEVFHFETKRINDEYFSTSYQVEENLRKLALSFYKKEEISNNPNEFIDFFSYPILKYYGKENASQEYMLENKRKYFKDWEQRIYQNIKADIVGKGSDGSIEVKIVFDYQLNNGAKQIEGVSSHFLTIKNINGKALITSIGLATNLP